MSANPFRWLADNGDAVLRAARNEVGRSVVVPERRAFLRRTLTLGGLSLLSGCALVDEESVENALTRISRFNDKAQGWLFDPQQLAPTYPDSLIARPFPFNAFYGENEIPVVDEEGFRLEVSGLVADRHAWTLAELRRLPQREQVTRHICVEGWSAIGKWGGVPFADFLRRIGADLSARYVGFKCADDYYTSIDMASAMHPQTLLALSCDGRTLEPRYGFPLKLRIPTKLGYKNPKHIQAIFVTNTYPGGYWEDQGYNWFGGS
ncbi:MAG TPA: molybdopterin-dependent oxidoreductase [Accumulibacter sp.]|uniref:molybdopterin-dependent oxidoreductase n=1 Tax=Accumulibacter sp. TaxID=2053492 RepID=UPI0026311900|nr:molybdopterin-dependent oxidoreductase [Accumulibacter sp.]HMW64590.1 molybdopterin-dependent oxidoreductase [Accumulibacter sp.]HMW81285.1 molybdopterin-dependent oxidoreductase [Accumulibacter sp.]HMX69541.1 molybdopterin-dependent oxidoreductase [Accumulibacter sp.]HNB68943.1 molybdopterin-dependent oxidoreductase [Accumulibacter sp.]HNG16762.1 molybdopterin-dependent oxidoreductase [Accumulibacter sp.]